MGIGVCVAITGGVEKKGEEDDVGGGERDVGEEQWLVDETLFSRTGDRRMESESGMSNYVTTSNSDGSIFTHNKGMSGTVFLRLRTRPEDDYEEEQQIFLFLFCVFWMNRTMEGRVIIIN